MTNLDKLSEQRWYNELVGQVVASRRARNARRILNELEVNTPREALAAKLRLPEHYLRTLLGEPHVGYESEGV